MILGEFPCSCWGQMALSIKNPQTEQAPRELAKMTGASITVAIQVALDKRIERKRLLDRDPEIH